MSDQNETPQDQQEPVAPIIPQELADLLNVGMSIPQAAAFGIDWAGKHPDYAEQQKQAAATNLLSERELDVASRAGMTAVDYLEAKKASAENRPIDG